MCDVPIFHVLYFNFSKDSWLSRFEWTIRDISIKSLKAIISFILYTNSLKTNDLPQYLGHSPGIPVGCGPLLGQHWLQTDIWSQDCPHLLTCFSLLCCACYCLGMILSGRVVVKSTCLAHSLWWIKIPHLPFRMASLIEALPEDETFSFSICWTSVVEAECDERLTVCSKRISFFCFSFPCHMMTWTLLKFEQDLLKVVSDIAHNLYELQVVMWGWVCVNNDIFVLVLLLFEFLLAFALICSIHAKWATVFLSLS